MGNGLARAARGRLPGASVEAPSDRSRAPVPPRERIGRRERDAPLQCCASPGRNSPAGRRPPRLRPTSPREANVSKKDVVLPRPQRTRIPDLVQAHEAPLSSEWLERQLAASTWRPDLTSE